MSCSNNTLFISRPSQNTGNSGTCSPGCGSSSLGPNDPLDKNLLGPRLNRQKVHDQIRDYIILMLGAPTLTLELDEQAVVMCIEQSLQIFEDYAPREFFSYYVFTTTAGKSIYQMPPEVGYVRNVFYKEMGTFAFQASDLDGAIPIEYFYPGGAYASIQGGLIDPVQPIWGRAGEWTLYKMYEQMYSRVSSNLGGWEWIGGYNQIKLYPMPFAPQKVVVHYLQKQKDWMAATQAMKELALAHAMIIVGHIRGRFTNPPGPGGGIQMDGDYMRTKGWELKEKIQNDLITKFGDILPITLD